MSWDALRRQALEQEEQRQSRSGGGKRFMPWNAQSFTIDVDDAGTIRILDPGETGPHGRLYHFTARGPRACTSEDPRFNGKCVYCWKYQKEKDAGTDSRLYQRFDRILELIDFRYFHAVDDPDNDNKYALVRCKSDAPIPKRNRCKHCRSDNESVAKRIFGGHKVWELGTTAWRQVWGLSERVARTCIHYNEEEEICLDEIYPVAYSCAECSVEQISEKMLESADEDEVKKFVAKKQECKDVKDGQDNIVAQGCGESTIWTPQYICASGEHEPVHAMIFHKKIPLTCTGEKKTRKIAGKQKTYTARTFNFEVQGEFSTVADDLEEFGFSEEDVAALCESWDLIDRYKPERVDRDDLDSDDEYVVEVFKKQAETLSMDSIPFKVTTTSKSTPFNNSGFQR